MQLNGHLEPRARLAGRRALLSPRAEASSADRIRCATSPDPAFNILDPVFSFPPDSAFKILRITHLYAVELLHRAPQRPRRAVGGRAVSGRIGKIRRETAQIRSQLRCPFPGDIELARQVMPLRPAHDPRQSLRGHRSTSMQANQGRKRREAWSKPSPRERAARECEWLLRATSQPRRSARTPKPTRRCAALSTTGGGAGPSAAAAKMARFSRRSGKGARA